MKRDDPGSKRCCQAPSEAEERRNDQEGREAGTNMISAGRGPQNASPSGNFTWAAREQGGSLEESGVLGGRGRESLKTMSLWFRML